MTLGGVGEAVSGFVTGAVAAAGCVVGSVRDALYNSYVGFVQHTIVTGSICVGGCLSLTIQNGTATLAVGGTGVGVFAGTGAVTATPDEQADEALAACIGAGFVAGCVTGGRRNNDQGNYYGGAGGIGAGWRFAGDVTTPVKRIELFPPW